MRSWKLLLPCFSIILFGCGTQPRSTYPVLEQIVESDDDLDCMGFDDELLKANAIRDEVFLEHDQVISEATLNTGTAIITEPISGVLFGLIRGMSTSKSSKLYFESAAAAGLRIEQMLVYKERDDCPSGATGEPGLTDSAALDGLHDLESQLRRQDITQKQYVLNRRVMLDKLR